LSLTTA